MSTIARIKIKECNNQIYELPRIHPMGVKEAFRKHTEEIKYHHFVEPEPTGKHDGFMFSTKYGTSMGRPMHIECPEGYSLMDIFTRTEMEKCFTVQGAYDFFGNTPCVKSCFMGKIPDHNSDFF